MDGHWQHNKRTNHTYDIFRYVFYTSDITWIFDFIYGYVGLFDIYSKQVRRVVMAKETMREMLKMIDAKIEHIEDISADNRAIIVKLVKQNNEIVKFLKSLELDIVTEENSYESEPQDDKLLKLMQLVEEFKENNEDFKKFLDEIEENKDEIVPGQFGES